MLQLSVLFLPLALRWCELPRDAAISVRMYARNQVLFATCSFVLWRSKIANRSTMASFSPLKLTVLNLFSLFHCINAQANSFSIGAYLPDYRFYINVNATMPFLTDLVLFSLQPTTTLDGCCLNNDHYRIARQAQSYKREHGYGELRLWVAVGGGGRSDGFATIASDLEKRTQLIDQLISLW